MRIRKLALALALALVLGLACKTSSKQGSAAAGGAAAGTDATAAAQAHQGDRVVAGVITGISDGSLTILSQDGTSHTLTLDSGTSFQVNGRDARRSDLQEGQAVRASFDRVSGDDVAVTIQARQP